MHPEALWAAATPLCTAVGAVVGFLLATEHTPLESDTEIHRGDSVDEPWGTPRPTREHDLPGFAGIMLPRDHGLDGMTAEYDIIDGIDDYELPDG